jgi:hypothetical protein
MAGNDSTWNLGLVYEEFIVAVRAINSNLRSSERIRVLAADYPIEWNTHVSNVALDRDGSAAALIQREVLSRNRKALILFGSAHLYRRRIGTIVERLQQDSKATWFVVAPVGGPGLPPAISKMQASGSAPILLDLTARALGNIAAADVLERGTKRIKVVDGKPVFVDGKPVFIPVFDPGIKVRELVDACLYSGLPEFIEPPRALYEATDYGREVQRRKQILMPQQ